MAFVGADTGQLRELADLMAKRADELSGDLVSNVSGRLSCTPWKGPDRQQFEDQWNRQLIQLIRNVAKALEEAAKAARKNAEDQDRASDGDNGFGDLGGGLADLARKFTKLFEPNGTVEPSGGSGTPQSSGGQSEGNGSSASPSEGAGKSAPVGDFDLNKANQEYGNRTADDFTNSYFAPEGPGDGQCTSWVNYRRKELGLDAPIRWNGDTTIFYSGPVSNDPTVGAVGSQPGHTFIVEKVSTGSGPRQITISEMNNGSWVDRANFITTNLGTVTTAVLTEVSPGVWRRPNGALVNVNFGQ